MKLTLPTDSAERKEYPLWRGLFAYFPAALAAIARHSKKSNDKHNPGEPIHHARGKSTDHEDCILRHTMDLGDLLATVERGVDTAEDWGKDLAPRILAEADARAWRSLAASQELHERFSEAPLAPGARLPAEEVIQPIRRSGIREITKPSDSVLKELRGKPIPVGNLLKAKWPPDGYTYRLCVGTPGGGPCGNAFLAPIDDSCIRCDDCLADYLEGL